MLLPNTPVRISFSDIDANTSKDGRELAFWETTISECLQKFDKSSYVIKYILDNPSCKPQPQSQSTADHHHHHHHHHHHGASINKFPRILQLQQNQIQTGKDEYKQVVYTDEAYSYITTTSVSTPTSTNPNKRIAKSSTVDVVTEPSVVDVNLCCGGMNVNPRILNHIINCLNGFQDDDEEDHPLSTEEQISCLHYAEFLMIK